MATARSVQREGRRGGRASRREARGAIGVRAWPVLERKVPTYEVLSEDRLEALHRASLKLLQEVGIDFRDEEALAMWRDAGADVDGERVRISEELLMALVAKAPSRFIVAARNPECSTEIGGDKVAFAPTYGSPFVYDFEGERRYGTLEDLNNFHKLAYMSPVLHNTGAVICEPVDISVPKRHLHITYERDQAFGQAVHGPGHGARARGGCRRDGEDRVRAGDGRSRAGDAVAHELQFAPGLGRDHARRDEGLCAG